MPGDDLTFPDPPLYGEDLLCRRIFFHSVEILVDVGLAAAFSDDVRGGVFLHQRCVQCQA
jgi:hypothetical protein